MKALRLLSIVFIIALFVSALLWIEFFSPAEGDIDIVVSKGVPASFVAAKLEEKGIIGREESFLAVARILHLDSKIKAGKYTFRKNLGNFRVLIALTRKGAGLQEVYVWIPEGSTIREIALRLNSIGVDTARFIKLTQDSAFIERLSRFFPRLNHPPTLEGYLFPDTYKFYWGASPEVIIYKMVRRLFNVLNDSMYKRMDELHMNLHQILTLASIIEKEAQVDFERPLISAVFHNRLRIRKPLESCATIQYILPEHKFRLDYRDLKVKSPYNSYIYHGLPPTPIGSPSLASIKAALWPAKVKYLYFVAKGDGTHFFARTYAEHRLNILKARKLWKKLVLK